MHGVGDVGKDGVKLCSEWVRGWNIIRCLWVEQYNDSVGDSVIAPLYSVSLGGLMAVDTPWETPSSNLYRTP